jgi:hypothetical protein
MAGAELDGVVELLGPVAIAFVQAARPRRQGNATSVHQSSLVLKGGLLGGQVLVPPSSKRSPSSRRATCSGADRRCVPGAA